MADHPPPRTRFEWPVYAHATLAGLATLVPIPMLDWWLEERFRRRMPKAIARYRGQTLPPPVLQALRSRSSGCLGTLLSFPLKFPIALLKRLSRKILYFLTVKEATDKLNYYWQRAFLLDYMLQAGHLTDAASARRAREAMDEVLATSPTPLRRLARTVVGSTRHVLRPLRRARRGHEEDALPEQQATMNQQWGQYEGDLRTLAARYEQVYRRRPEEV